MTHNGISCIVPVFNSERFLSAMLDSIVAQTHQVSEIIVVDDGSTDSTKAIVESYGERIRYFRQNNLGSAAARNFGVRQSRHPFLSFLDHDDLWYREKLELQMAQFTTKAQLDICLTYVTLLCDKALSQEQHLYRHHRRGQTIPGYATISMLAKRNTFDIIGPRDASLWFGDATYWFLRAREMDMNIHLMPQALVSYRMHSSNLMRRRQEASRDEFVRIVKASLDRRRSGEAEVRLNATNAAALNNADHSSELS
jgi:glycosyltransferase involved in cell wall biosynthesis